MDGKSKEEIAPVSQGQLGDKEDPLSRRLTFDGEDADGTSTPSSQEGNQAVTSTRNPAEIYDNTFQERLLRLASVLEPVRCGSG